MGVRLLLVDVRLLGELEHLVDDGSAVPVRGVKARTLLAVLALHRGEPVPPDRLIDILWGDAPPGNPANALQALVATLRRTIGADKVTTTDAGYAVAIAPEELDIVRFERLVGEGRRHLEAGDAAQASDTLRAALALCRDEPLVEFAYAEFAIGERARLQELVLVTVETRVDADLALGRHAEVVGELEALCEQHPLRERLWELRVLALYRCGRQADALRAYADARGRLVEELGLEPGPGLRELEARVLAQDPALDLRLGPAHAQPGNLRPALTSFIGREEDLARLVASVGSHRLVTLIGPGGVGKTRLAVEAAAALRAEVSGGAWMVELAGIRDPGDVAAAMAAALQVSRSGTMAGSTLDLVVGHLRGRSLVVVLDNCEHVVGEAAVAAETLVGQLHDLRLIATSREALGVPGEVLFPVPALGLDAAANVFADRAGAVRPGFAVDDANRPLVEDVCRRLDGLPLAVELAAARLRALPLAQLAGLLDDRFRVLTGGARTALPRQQTLRAVVDWSYDLLFEDERRLFARLSVFAGGWSLAAAEAVCSDELLPRVDILDVLLHLVDKSLVVADVDGTGEARYSQLQTLWHYARGRLLDSGEADAVRERHGRWYLTLAEGAHKGLRGRSGPTWRARLSAERENLRAALDWFIERGDAEAALSLAEGIAWLWLVRGEPHEGRRWLSEALGVPGAATPARAAASAWHGFYHSWIEGPASGLPEVSAAVVELRHCSEPERLTDALAIAADLYNHNNELEAAQAALDEARRVIEATGDDWGRAALDIRIARNLAARGDLDAAEDAARSSVAGLRAVGEAWLIFDGLGLLAMLHEARGHLEAAATTYRELIAEARAGGMPNFEMQCMARLASVCARQGDDDSAAQLFAQVAATTAIEPVNTGFALIGRAGATRRLGEATTARRWLDEALSLYESMGLDGGCAAALTSLCWWSLASGEVEEAAAFAAEACRRTAVRPRSRMAIAAKIAAAAVAYSRSGTAANRDRFTALVEQQAAGGVRRYDGLLGGSISGYFDEPDVAAFARSLGLTPAGA